MIVLGKDLGLALCEIFGLVPDQVSKITIVAEADGFALVQIEKAIEVTEGDGLVKVIRSMAGMKKFHIEKKE